MLSKFQVSTTSGVDCVVFMSVTSMTSRKRFYTQKRCVKSKINTIFRDLFHNSLKSAFVRVYYMKTAVLGSSSPFLLKWLGTSSVDGIESKTG